MLGAAVPGALAAADSEELVTLNMRDADIRAVIQWIAEQTHRQIVIDPRVQGQVSVLADRPMTIAQAYQVFLALLSVHGFSSSDTDGVLRIYPAALAKTSPKELVENFEAMDAAGQVMHVVTVKNVPSAALAELVKPLLSAGGYVAPLAETNGLVLADEGGNVRRLLELVQRMDRSGSLEIDVVKLQHAGARDAAQVLSSLVRPGADNTEAGSASASLAVAADERSNSVLLAGDPVSRERAVKLLRQLDQPIASAGNTRVVYLHYASAEELVPALKSMVASEQKESKDQSSKTASVTIEANKSTNALVLSGPPDLLDNMQDVIAKLDIRRAQVLVEAVIVEINQELAHRLGVEWNTSFGGDGVQAATNFGLRPTPSGTVTDPLALLSSGLTLGYYRNGSLRALLNALTSTNQANILSTPSVMTLDNQEAQIIVGSNIPIVTGQATGSSSTTADPFTTYERQDIGVTLKITPQINEGSAVTLDITQEVQTVADTTGSDLADAKDIVTNKRSITTKVLVHDDTTVVLGGLISEQGQEIVSKVPLLGDMPVVGKLFRSTDNKTTKQNLMVFIHPTIVDSGAAADSLTRRSYEAMRVQQLKYHGGKFEEDTRRELPEFEQFQPKNKPAPAPAAEPAPDSATSPAR